MKIDRKLNLVIPIDRGDNSTLWVHATPLRKEIFEKYYLVLAKTFSMLSRNGLDPRSGPSVAALVLKDTAMSTARDLDSSWWDGEDGIGGKTGLIAEIVRLCNCLAGTDEGWKTTPLQDALDKAMISTDEKSEVMNLLVFFTVSSLVAPKQDREILINGMAAIYRLESTFSAFTEWTNFCKTRMQDASIGEKAIP